VLLKNPESTTSRAGRIGRARREQVRRDDTEEGTQLKDVPALAPENRDGGAIVSERIALPGDGLNQAGLAAAIWPENTYMLAGLDAQSYILQRRMVSPHHRDIFQGEKRD
jgi:hypothetical protein